MISLLVTGISVAVAAAAGRTAKDCEIGDQWTANYIRFECFGGEGLVVKGVRALGCVPTNTESGAMIEPGATFVEQHFTYSCNEKDDVVSYRIKNCRDSAGKAIRVNETSRTSDGVEWRCYVDHKGKVKLAIGGTCIHKGKEYPVGDKWMEKEEMKATVAGKEQIIGKGLLMRCAGDSKKGYVVETYGCVTSTGAHVPPGGFAAVGKLYVQCQNSTATKGGALQKTTLNVVDESAVKCSHNETTIQSNTQYISKDGDIFFCKCAVLKKTGCMFKGKEHKTGLIMLDGKINLCSPTAVGVISFGDTTGCTLPDGTVKPFFSQWTKGTEGYQCKYKIKANKMSTYILVGCAYNGAMVDKYNVAGTGSDLKKCSWNGKNYDMRVMSKEEIEAYHKSKSRAASKEVIGGVGGSGSGGEITGQPKKTTVRAPAKNGGPAPAKAGASPPAKNGGIVPNKNGGPAPAKNGGSAPAKDSPRLPSKDRGLSAERCMSMCAATCKI